MKHPKIIFTALIVVFIFSVTAYTACKKDLCKDVLCRNGGVCNNGLCNCPDGFTGTNCETEKDPCIDIVCQNGGTCLNGTCNCQATYTGIYCEKTFASGLVGMYSCSESCQPPTSSTSWNSQVKVSFADERRIVITDFGDYDEEVSGLVHGNTVTLDTKYTGTAEIRGSGNISGNVMVVTYTHTQSGQTDSCIITMIRQ